MTLLSLFNAIKSDKIITINLYNENDLLLITFGLPGYDALDDYLLERKVDTLEIQRLDMLKIKIKAQENNENENSNSTGEENP